MDFQKIKNIIFDLGGVVIDIDFQLTVDAFAKIAGQSSEEVDNFFTSHAIYDTYEKGIWSNQDFRDYMREHLSLSQSDDEINQAWNALLLDLPKERVELIKSLRGKYNLFVLSNTSGIHIDGVNEILHKSSGVENLKDIFDKVYYSYEMGLRKPGEEIYTELLKDSKLEASETLFLDDNLENVKASREVGIHTIHVTGGKTILDLLKEA